MIELNIPGVGRMQLEHLVCDVNGTLAHDGALIEGVAVRLNNLRDRLKIHLLTADTHGKENIIDQQLSIKAVIISPGNESLQKAEYVEKLGKDRTAVIGQGANDALMLERSTLGICVLSPEGTSPSALASSDIITPDIISALDLFEKPLRIVASLRR